MLGSNITVHGQDLKFLAEIIEEHESPVERVSGQSLLVL